MPKQPSVDVLVTHSASSRPWLIFVSSSADLVAWVQKQPRVRHDVVVLNNARAVPTARLRGSDVWLRYAPERRVTLLPRAQPTTCS